MKRIRRRLTVANFNQLKDCSFSMHCDVDYAAVMRTFVTKCGSHCEEISFESPLAYIPSTKVCCLCLDRRYIVSRGVGLCTVSETDSCAIFVAAVWN